MNVAELERQVEYKQAPAPLLAVQALANTYSFEDDEELLLSDESTREWLLGSDLATVAVEIRPGERLRLIEFREAVRGLIGANLTGSPEAALERVLPYAGSHPVRLAATAPGELGLDLEPVGSVDELIAQMLGIVFQAQRDEQWPRLKICAADECRWAFYDSSKNRGGHWCRMDLCGNRVKNRRYRERGAAGARTGD